MVLKVKLQRPHPLADAGEAAARAGSTVGAETPHRDLDSGPTPAAAPSSASARNPKPPATGPIVPKSEASRVSPPPTVASESNLLPKATLSARTAAEIKLPKAELSQLGSDQLPSSTAGLEVIVSPASVYHRFTRSHDVSTIVERPERIRAALLGVCAASARLSLDSKSDNDFSAPGATQEGLDKETTRLVRDMEGLCLQPSTSSSARVSLVKSSRQLCLDPPDPAVAFIHANENELISYHDTSYSRSVASHALLPSAGEGAYAPYLQKLCRAAPSAPINTQESPHRANRARTSRTLHASSASHPDADFNSTSSEDALSHPSEIPDTMHQGDLYLCGPTIDPADPHHHLLKDLHGSGEAIRTSLGACASAVDRVMSSRSKSCPTIPSLLTVSERDALDPPQPRVLCLVRPPGHHCAGSTPQGFCWTNNVAVAASHAYKQHGVDRIAIFDIDLHHGNGTQALAWRINADTVQHDLMRQALLSQADQTRKQVLSDRRGCKEIPSIGSNVTIPPRGLKIFYGSVHDIESYPCEEGDAEMVMAASTCIEGAHGQWIWNVHLGPYETPQEFQELYEMRYKSLFAKAGHFFQSEDAEPARSMVLISCGFDACEHEYPGMQRHGKSVPVGFYGQFASDSVALANTFTEGKIVSFLEGGYADRAITSGVYAHTLGLAMPHVYSCFKDRWQSYWGLDRLISLERTLKKGAVSIYRTPKAHTRIKKGACATASTDAETRHQEEAWLSSVLDRFRAWTIHLPGQVPVPEPPAGPKASDTSTKAKLPKGPRRSVRVLRSREPREGTSVRPEHPVFVGSVQPSASAPAPAPVPVPATATAPTPTPAPDPPSLPPVPLGSSEPTEGQEDHTATKALVATPVGSSSAEAVPEAASEASADAAALALRMEQMVIHASRADA